MLSSDRISHGLRNRTDIGKVSQHFINVGGPALLDVVSNKGLRLDNAAKSVRFYKQPVDEVPFN
jgi:hypothetical protein